MDHDCRYIPYEMSATKIIKIIFSPKQHRDGFGLAHEVATKKICRNKQEFDQNRLHD